MSSVAPDDEEVLDLLTRFLAEEPEGEVEALRRWLEDRGPEPAPATLAAALEEALEDWRGAGELLGQGGLGAEGGPASTPVHPAPGLRIGHFVLRRFIASGSMGQVWEAEDERLRRSVALKLVLPSRINTRSLALFAREARAGGRLSHPGLVATLAYGSDGELAWIAQELVPGSRTLRNALEQLRAADQVPRGHHRRAARLVARLAEALHAAHEAGVIHRDLKPANVLLTDEDEPKLTDFGLARVQDDSFHSESTDLVGTWAYMSPEQLDADGSVDRRSDVFALGVLLYELLTLRRPFEGDTTAQVADRIRRHEPVPAHEVRSQVPRDLSVIAGKALEKVPGARYATALELARDLDRYLADEPIHAHPPGALTRGAKWVRRNPTLSASGAVLVLALAVVSSLVVSLARQTRLAESERESVLRLSAQQDLESLVREQRELWPTLPGQVEALSSWVDRAEALVARLPQHRSTLRELRTGGDEAVSGATAEERERRTRWWQERLARLVDELEALERDQLDPAAVTSEHGWSVARRLELARSLERGAAPGGAVHAAWTAHLPELRADHPGLPLEPRADLLPLGRDPRSGLFEYAHLPSGEPARRGPDGTLAIGPETGLVLVLIPGGSDVLGAQQDDPGAPNHDPMVLAYSSPPREVRLAPFLLSKYEVTQEQWRRVTGTSPSKYERPGSPVPHPVEQVDWRLCARFCLRLGLELPSEDSWEYAARAGADTRFWTGPDLEDLEGAANVADRTQASVTSLPWVEHDPIDDGHAQHSPVGILAPNAFGLHDVHGNVWEWCLDAYSPVDGSRVPEEEAARSTVPLLRGYRGGSFNDRGYQARLGNGLRDIEGYQTYALGLRPALRLDRP